jgi:chemotaxis signal transduction protein
MTKEMDSHNLGKRLDLVIDRIDSLLSAAPGSFSKPLHYQSVDPADLPQKFLLAGIGDLKAAFPMESIGEIGTTPEITPLPNLPPWILGIVNIRGEIMSVIHLGDFLGVDSLAAKRGDRFAVLLDGNIKVVVLIDRIIGTTDKSAAEQNLAVSLQSAERDLANFVRKGFFVDDQPAYIVEAKSLLTSRRFLDYRRTTVAPERRPHHPSVSAAAGCM